MKKQIPLKGSHIPDNLIAKCKTFDEFYKWADAKFSAPKKDFEDLYYKVHPKPTKKKGED